MSRFYFPPQFFRVVNKGSLLAAFRFVDNETGLEYSNFTLIQGKNGPFAKGPFESYEKADGSRGFSDHVKPAYDASSPTKQNSKGRAFMETLTEAALALYQGQNGGTSRASASSSPSDNPPSGRGPVSVPEDKLPF